MRRTFLVVFIVLGILSLEMGCVGKTKNKVKEQPIVKVFGDYLYQKDIKNLVPKGSSAEDSANLVQTYVNNWIQNKLMLHFAEEYLKSQKKEIEKKTEDFKNSLLIHQFKLQLVKINSDSSLSSEQIERYYNIHYQEFRLNSSIIKGFFIKIPVKSEGIDNFKKILHSSDESNMDEMVSYVNSVHGNFEDFTKNWVNFPATIMKIPIAIEKPDEFLRTHKFIEATDKNYYYLLFVSDYIERGKVAPIDYARESIIKILQKEKSIAILKQFQKNKYNEALKEGDIEFFK